MSNGKLANKVVLVTGGGRGWGRSICMAFARHGARVVVVSRTLEEINETVRLIEEEGGTALAVSTDLSEKDQIDEMIEITRRRFGPIDILINNAAVLILKDFKDLSPEEIDLTLHVNLHSYIYLCKKILPRLLEEKTGVIINVSSNAGIWAFEKESIYASTKFAIEGFTKCLALELKPFGIPANTVTPGGTELGVRIKPTSITQADFDDMSDADKAIYTDSIMYTEAFIYLSLPENRNISGERVLAYELSQSIRDHGWNVPYQRLTQKKP